MGVFIVGNQLGERPNFPTELLTPLFECSQLTQLKHLDVSVLIASTLGRFRFEDWENRI
jgi:hypothetical protein